MDNLEDKLKFDIITVNVIANNDQDFSDHEEYQIVGKSYKNYDEILTDYRKLIKVLKK